MWLCIADVVPGGTIDPGGLVGGLARAATAAGATIHEHARVDALEPGTPVPVRTARGTVLADRVVVALNAYTTTLVDLPVRLGTALTLGVCTAPLHPATITALEDRLSAIQGLIRLDRPYVAHRMH